MPAFVFHQNMRNYGGGSWLRNLFYDGDLNNIGAATAALYIVAGFTEIRNGTTAQNFVNRAQALDGTLTAGTLIEVGVTAVGNKIEYLGIAWDPASVAVANAGQVLYNTIAQRWQCHNTAIPGAVPAVIALPGSAPPGGGKRRRDDTQVADSRGIAYVSGVFNGTNRIFAFMHNMYGLGDRSSAFTALNTMVNSINATLGIAGTRTYLGGDFNLAPRDPRNGYALTHAAARNVANTAYLLTTAANPYDFWLTDQGLPHARASVHYQTLNAQSSDHAGILLTL